MKTNTCRQCRFWLKHKYQDSNSHDDEQGECHAYPPVLNSPLLVLQSREITEKKERRDEYEHPVSDAELQEATEAYCWSFPTVRNDAWCGQWKDKRPVIITIDELRAENGQSPARTKKMVRTKK